MTQRSREAEPDAKPASPASGFSLRAARPDDLATLMAIDDAAGLLYEQHGLPLSLEADHPFVVAERDRWARAIAQRAAFVGEVEAEAVGFATLHPLDGEPYLDQVSVHPSYARRGLGRALVHRAEAWAREQAGARLWLTTYAHLPWNAPFYTKLGFVEVPPREHGPELRKVLAAQRVVLPDPHQRIAMALALRPR